MNLYSKFIAKNQVITKLLFDSFQNIINFYRNIKQKM